MREVLHAAAVEAAQSLASKLKVPAGSDLSELVLLYEQLMVNKAGGNTAEPQANSLWTEATMAEAFAAIQEFSTATPPSEALQQAMALDMVNLMPDVQALVARHVGPVAEGGKNPLTLVSALANAVAYVAVSNGMHPAVFFQTIAGVYGQTLNQVLGGVGTPSKEGERFMGSAVVKDAEGNEVPQ